MLDPRSPFMTALLKSQEARLVGREHLERLATATMRPDARVVLRDTDIGTWLEDASWRNSEERDGALWRYLAETLGAIELRRFFPRDARRFSRAYLLKYDVANIRAVLQGLALGCRPRLLPVGVMHAKGLLEALAAVQKREELEEVLSRAGLRKFVLALHSTDSAAGRRGQLAVDAALEGEYHRELRHAVRGQVGGHILGLACGLLLDLANLSVLCRLLVTGAASADTMSFIPGGNLLDADDLRDALSHGLHDLPRRLEPEIYRKAAADVVAAYEREQSVAVIEAVIERHRLAALRGLLASTLAPAAVIAWFIVLKEIELRNVRLLLTAAEDGLALDKVRRHLML
jgi:vacuolar-type H+-ATPase subunit C/Vma6